VNWATYYQSINQNLFFKQ